MFSRILDQYRGSTAVVIGAGGIGGEIVRLLAPCVARLVVADHNESLLASLAEKYPASLLLTRKLDVRDSLAVAEFASFLSTTVGAPQFLFYTAGILTVEPFVETTSRDWERAVAINLHGAFYCTKAVAELMLSQNRGSILLLGSIAGTKARSGSRVNPVYNVTKAGIAAFVNATAMQLRSRGVRINCISPGPTATPMMDVQPPRVHASIQEITLDGRLNHPAEVAELALFVAAHGRFTGEDVCMGGGAGLGG
jgi:3-oxoacyl-[acyl-carrier protein] reductase